jgi:hypothetical protein
MSHEAPLPSTEMTLGRGNSARNAIVRNKHVQIPSDACGKALQAVDERVTDFRLTEDARELGSNLQVAVAAHCAAPRLETQWRM